MSEPPESASAFAPLPPESPPGPPAPLPLAPAIALPPVPPAALPPVPAVEPCISPSTQARKLPQSAIAHALYALSRSARAWPDLDDSDVLITSLHWAAVIPDRVWHVSAFRQTSPATSGPPPRQPIAPIASSAAAAAGNSILPTVF